MLNNRETTHKFDDKSFWTEVKKYQIIVDNLAQDIWLKDTNFAYIGCNENFARDLGVNRDSITGKNDFNLFPRDLAEKYRVDDERVLNSGVEEEMDEPFRKNGRVTTIHTIKTPIRNEQGEIIAILGIFWDITEADKADLEKKKYRDQLEEMVRNRTADMEQSNARLKQELADRKKREEIIAQQANEILELSTPSIQVWDGIVITPLIGMLNSARTQGLMESLLQRIVETSSPIAIIDITGVPAVDTQTAQHLIETISAVKLLGSQVILTGVRPAIAQTLVHLGIDLSGVITQSSLALGLRAAFNLVGYQVTRKQ